MTRASAYVSPAAEERVELGGKLAGKTLPMQVLVLAVWPLMEQLLASMVGLVDMVLGARLEPTSLAEAATDALGVGVYFGWLINIVLGSVGTGAGALVARAIGGRHKRLANAALGQALTLGLIASLVVGGLLFALAPSLAASLGGGPGGGPGVGGGAGSGDAGNAVGMSLQAQHLAAVYLRVLAAAMPFAAVLFIGSGCLRAAGDTRTPFLVMVVVNLVNIVVSLLLAWDRVPLPGLGVSVPGAGLDVMGIALGTTTAWTLGGAIVLTVLLRGRLLRLRWPRLLPHAHTIWRIARISGPNAAEWASIWGGNFVVLWIVAYITTDGVLGAHSMAIRIEAFAFLPGVALGTAVATLVGQYLGAGSVPMARKAAWWCVGVGALIQSVMGLVFIVLGGGIAAAVSEVPVHREVVPQLLFICGWVQPFFALAIVFSHALRGAGDTRSTLVISLVSMFVWRLPLVVVATLVLGWGINGVWLVLCSDWIVRGSLMAGRFLHGGWTRVKV